MILTDTGKKIDPMTLEHAPSPTHAIAIAIAMLISACTGELTQPPPNAVDQGADMAAADMPTLPPDMAPSQDMADMSAPKASAW